MAAITTPQAQSNPPLSGTSKEADAGKRQSLAMQTIKGLIVSKGIRQKKHKEEGSSSSSSASRQSVRYAESKTNEN